MPLRGGDTTPIPFLVPFDSAQRMTFSGPSRVHGFRASGFQLGDVNDEEERRVFLGLGGRSKTE